MVSSSVRCITALGVAFLLVSCQGETATPPTTPAGTPQAAAPESEAPSSEALPSFQPPVPAQGLVFGVGHGIYPRHESQDPLLRAPASALTRRAVDCQELADPGWETICGTALSSGGRLA